ncbi:hypothetical protein FACS1894219_12890 [Clostridia bacterium]|nr:hypothetical protein FACS1894219_12890 [Clostridia bacterium]
MDGISYDVGVVSLKREAKMITDPVTEGLMLDFSESADMAGTKYSYTLTVEAHKGAENCRAEYDAFYYDITSPESVRIVELPFGQSVITFEAKILAATDTLKRRNSGESRWEKLNVTFVPVRPQRFAEALNI